jgi:[protein-PII] uridylyltransferase
VNDCLVDDAEPTIRYYRSPLKDLADYSDPDLFDALTFDATLATYHTPKKRIPLFRSALQAATEILKQRFLSGVLAADLVPQRAWLIDQLLYRAWTHLETLPSHDVALVAVGGYGRGELHPGSDIDLLILVGTHDRDSFYNEIERFIVCLWDIGLEVGHSVRSLEECVSEATNDVTVATNLMEARLIAGPKPLFEALKVCTGPEQVWPSDRFFFAKRREQRARHAKFDDTAYNLEPNVKGSPGGLRDIQMIGWVAKRHFGAKTLHGLVDHEFLTEAEYDRLIAGQNFLWQVRFGLHSLTGRKEDRLLFDYQKTLATQFGFHDNEHSLAVEKFMQRYYRVVNELSRLNEMLLQLFEEVIEHPARQAAPVPLNTRFQVHNDFIEVVDDKVFRDYPLGPRPLSSHRRGVSQGPSESCPVHGLASPTPRYHPRTEADESIWCAWRLSAGIWPSGGTDAV